MAGPVIFAPNDGNIAGFALSGGALDRHLRTIILGTEVRSVMNAPVRTGKLKSNIRKAWPKPTRPLRATGYVYANVGYAAWVHEGTDTIFPSVRKYLTIPRMRHSGPGPNPSGATLRKAWFAEGGEGEKPYFTARSVSGQDSNPFMADALEEAMRMAGHGGFTV